MGGAPLDLIDSVSPLSPAAESGLPPLTCLALGSFLGGVGAWSGCGGAGDGVGSAAPSGPRGSASSSTDCNMVDWASTFLAGAFLPPGVRVGAGAGVSFAGWLVAVATIQLIRFCCVSVVRSTYVDCLLWRWAMRIGSGHLASQHRRMAGMGTTHRPKVSRP